MLIDRSLFAGEACRGISSGKSISGTHRTVVNVQMAISSAVFDNIKTVWLALPAVTESVLVFLLDYLPTKTSMNFAIDQEVNAPIRETSESNFFIVGAVNCFPTVRIQTNIVQH